MKKKNRHGRGRFVDLQCFDLCRYERRGRQSATNHHFAAIVELLFSQRNEKPRLLISCFLDMMTSPPSPRKTQASPRTKAEEKKKRRRKKVIWGFKATPTSPHKVGPRNGLPYGVVVAEVRVGHEGAVQAGPDVGDAAAVAVGVLAAQVQQLLVDGDDLAAELRVRGRQDRPGRHFGGMAEKGPGGSETPVLSCVSGGTKMELGR